MKKVPLHLKMRVLGALEYAEGKTLKQRYQSVAAMGFKDEEGHSHQFTWRTIQTWWYWYRKNGMVMPPQRADKDCARKVSPEECLSAINKALPTIDKNQPLNIQALYRACIEQGHLQRSRIAPNTFRRHVNNFDLLKDVGDMSQSPQKRMRLAFAKAHANDMWQVDTLHGPYVTIEGKPLKTFLLCFIDDCSRIIAHGQFYLSDNTDHLIDCFQTALFNRGVPQSLYADNGSNYISKELTLICARLGIQLIHTPVRDGAAKGKIERFFRTVRSNFLLRNLSAIRTLTTLNSQFIDWVEQEYHQRQHSTLGMKPIDRFGMDLKRLRYLSPSPHNKELFYLEQNRRVRADNTFQFKGARYEAPRDLRNSTMQVRFNRIDPSVAPIVYHQNQRLGEATLIDFTSNDRGPKFEDQP